MKELVFEGRNSIKVIAWLSSLLGSLEADKQYVVTVKKFRKKRSLDANAYAWVLIDKLAEKMKMKKTDIYRNAIREIGGNSETICVQDKAVDKICQGWTHNGEGWQYEIKDSKIEGCKNITLYYGSSIYDTEQMSRLIDCIVEDCRALGIETMTPDELEALKEQWK